VTDGIDRCQMQSIDNGANVVDKLWELVCTWDDL
jgi:hypothetical protein